MSKLFYVLFSVFNCIQYIYSQCWSPNTCYPCDSYQPTIVYTQICSTMDEDWKLVFYDEFNGTNINADKWLTCYYDGSNCTSFYSQTHCGIDEPNSESQAYLPDNVVVSDGSLKLVAKKENYTINGITKNYTSGVINSKARYYKGRFEIRCKLPKTKGFWRAF